MSLTSIDPPSENWLISLARQATLLESRSASSTAGHPAAAPQHQPQPRGAAPGASLAGPGGLPLPSTDKQPGTLGLGTAQLPPLPAAQDTLSPLFKPSFHQDHHIPHSLMTYFY